MDNCIVYSYLSFSYASVTDRSNVIVNELKIMTGRWLIRCFTYQSQISHLSKLSYPIEKRQIKIMTIQKCYCNESIKIGAGKDIPLNLIGNFIESPTVVRKQLAH